MDVKKLLSYITPFSPFQWIGKLFNTVKGEPNNPTGVESLFGSLLGKYAGTNLTGAEKEANAFSSLEAEKNRAFQSEMSNTEYQRGVADMRAAGLNPALMMSGASGASTPSGSNVSSVSPSIGSFSDLFQLLALPSQIANINADTKKKIAEADTEIPARVKNLLSTVSVNEQNAKNLSLDAEQKSIVLKYFDRQQSFYTEGLGLSNERIQQDIAESVSRVQNLSAEYQKILQDIVESNSRVSLLLSQQHLTEAQAAEVYHLIDKIDAETVNIQKNTELTEKDIQWYSTNHIWNNLNGSVSAVSSAFSRFNPIKRNPFKGYTYSSTYGNYGGTR